MASLDRTMWLLAVGALALACPPPIAPCGDGTCDWAGGETLQSCPTDCGEGCGDGVCTEPESIQLCPVDCYCGNGSCEEAENGVTCAEDCAASCGNGLCEAGEDRNGCPGDCPESQCGNAACEPGETMLDCPQDCLAPQCSNGACEPGEDTYNCLADCPASCGNGLLEATEECDGTVGASNDCEALTGLGEGVVSCDAACNHDVSACHICGDGVAQPAELCDGQDLVGLDCLALGYSGGTLACHPACLLDESQCYDCGDGWIHQLEACDGLALQAQSCLTLTGHTAGEVACATDCLSFDTTDCHSCGDGVVEGPEVCDSSALLSESCTSLAGHASGQLGCAMDCLSFDTTDCHSCGDGVQDGPEICDGPQLAGQTCTSQTGYLHGVLTCLTTCDGYDTSGCHTCGDNVVEAVELCDGPNLAGRTCVDAGFTGGTVGCTTGCTLDPVDCYLCGDGVCQWTLGEDHAGCPTDCEAVLWTRIVGDNSSTCGLTAAGQAYCWGNNTYQKSGAGPAPLYETPQLVMNLPSGNVVDFGTGQYHSCAVMDSGYIYCWGRNWDGQLGDTTTTDHQVVTTSVYGIHTAVAICTRSSFNCALLASGEVRCWGASGSGQMGVGSWVDQPTPVEPLGLPSAAVDIACSGGHVCVVLDNGTAWCWGAGNDGQLGDGQSTTSMVPVPVSGLTGATQISAGYNHTCARLSSGGLLCWGNNGREQLGALLSGSQATPVSVTGISDAVQVAAGMYHTCARRATGALLCWGSDGGGQVGVGTNVLQYGVPQPVTALSGVLDTYARYGMSCAITANGAAWCWGSDEYGKLGNGPEGDKNLPWRVADP